MFLPLAVLLAASAPTVDAQDPAVRIDLNSDGRYETGDRARVKVRPAEDGYLLVLRTDVNGWVRVMFPVDPGDDNYVHGGRDVEVKGRGGREAFQTGLTEGAGTILAARSAESFHFDRYVRDGHWNYRALDSLRADQGSDPQAVLLGVAQQLAGDSHFDYDFASYSVTDRYAAETAYGYPPAYRYGPYPWYYDPYSFYDPFYYSAFYYSPLFFGAYCYGCFPRFYYSVGFVYPYRPYRGYRSFAPGYRPRGAVVGVRGGARMSPMAPPTRGASPAPTGGRRMSSYAPSPGFRRYGGSPAMSARGMGAMRGAAAPRGVSRGGGGGGGGGRRR